MDGHAPADGGAATAVAIATGQSFTAMAVHEMEIEDGTIVRHTIVTNTLAIRRSLPAGADSAGDDSPPQNREILKLPGNFPESSLLWSCARE